MNNLITRTLTGIVFLAVLISSICINAYSYGALFTIIVALGIYEFAGLLWPSGNLMNKIGITIIGTSAFALHFLVNNQNLQPLVYWIFIPLLVALMIRELYTKNELPINNLSNLFFILFYFVMPFIALTQIGFESGVYNSALVISFFSLIWINDTGAYVFGVSFGKHRLFERISPKKSWEGFFGGVLMAQIGAWIIYQFTQSLNPIDWHIIALIVSIFGTLGDLIESMFKRSLNIKDSGNILPGHGGILDRFDAVVLAAPMVLFYLQIKI